MVARSRAYTCADGGGHNDKRKQGNNEGVKGVKTDVKESRHNGGVIYSFTCGRLPTNQKSRKRPPALVAVTATATSFSCAFTRSAGILLPSIGSSSPLPGASFVDVSRNPK